MPKKLWYDESCPICRTFKDEIVRRTSGEIECIPCDPSSKDFVYENEQGRHVGRLAIAQLMKDFPKLSPTLSILPEKWRVLIMEAFTSIASVGRTVIKSAVALKTKNCNCGG